MKRIFYFVIPLFGFLSCQKTSTCKCTDGHSYSVDASKKTLKEACDKYSTEEISCKAS
ncbi:hypothetical protein D3C71_589110 [compost metagenome]